MDGAVSWTVAHAGDPDQARACVERTVEQFGALHILVNNAATNPYFGALIDIDRSRAEKTLEVNQLRHGGGGSQGPRPAGTFRGPDIAQSGSCDVNQETDGPRGLWGSRHDVRTTGYNARAAFTPMKQKQCFTDRGRAIECFDALEHGDRRLLGL